MRQAVLLGNPDTKRTMYLQKAAEQEGVSLLVQDWKEWTGHLPEGELFLKIDPPLWSSYSLEELDELTGSYRRDLDTLVRAAEERQTEFLNTPSVILELLDKRRCKERLMRACLPVTEFLEEDSVCQPQFSEESGQIEMCRSRQSRIRDTEQLLDQMKQMKVYQVFIKPVRGSGAAGVSAFRLQPGTGRMTLYTCAMVTSGGGLVNTKKLRNYRDTGEIQRLLDKILDMDCVVERWHAKAVYGTYAYDLRVVVQDGRMDYLLARLSKGPITNLQLNNHPLSMEELNLPFLVRKNVEELCLAAADCFPGLGSAGIDILLEKGSLKPRIIEMNAQGDLIYQDIYHENIIYRRQAAKMREWLLA